MTNSRWKVGVVLGLVGAVAGCGQSYAGGSPVDWSDRVPTDAPAQFRTLLDDAVFGPEPAGPDLAAQQTSIQECMAEKGFDYVPEPIGMRPADSDLPLAVFSAIPVEYAEQYGYGLSTFIVATESVGDNFAVGVTPENAELARQADGGEGAWVDALHQVPDGCLPSADFAGEEDTTPAPDELEPDQTLLDAYDESWAALEESDEMADALELWRGCMENQGLGQYQSRHDIFDELLPDAFEGNPNLEQVQERELTLATADVACADPVVQAGHQFLANAHAQVVRDNASLVRTALTARGVSSDLAESLESIDPADVVTSY